MIQSFELTIARKLLLEAVSLIKKNYKLAGKRKKFHLPAGMLKWLFELTVWFISYNETRYYPNGFCLELKADEIRAVSTDGHRLDNRFVRVPYQSVNVTVGSNKASATIGHTALKRADGLALDATQILTGSYHRR